MAQDFASRLRPVGQRDADRLSALFNMMMDALHRERSRVLEQNHYLGLLVESSPMGSFTTADWKRIPRKHINNAHEASKTKGEL